MSRVPHVLYGPYAPPAPGREFDVTSSTGARLHVAEHGPADGPTVVLVHGWTCSIAFWAPVIRRLVADGHRVVAYDQRGHGRSSPTPGRYSTHALADDLCAVLEAVLPPGRRAVLGGHSMGGMTLMAAASRPTLRHRAAALMLCSTGAEHLSREARVLPLPGRAARGLAHRLLLGASLPLGPVTPVTRRALTYATMGPGATPDQQEAVARVVHACPRRVRAGWGAVLHTLALAREVPRLTVPTAVVVGTHDRLTPRRHARELVAALPHCVGLHELPGLGHMTPVEDPAAVADVLRDLVRDHLVAPGVRRSEWEETA
ncbi:MULTISPECIES: alpha/beta fold hydrolase [Streptomyces]|uniref:alpha/beta fold hydrolase n=1 Tax=Streptomyces TaxID=1883 RepID=UPI002249624F|nr:alpha/beta hydrolase [Streptomyces sp. JHD 1]MCX2968153.1 alpha/beta hydrolase [Streptomyces sp. JHD 1]